MTSILKLFANPTLAEILSLVLLHPEEEFYQSGLARKTGKALMQVQRALKTLTEIGLVGSKQRGRMMYYSAVKTHPAFEDLNHLFLKTVALGENIRQALLPLLQKIQCAFIFGSIAKGEESSGSDIDLFMLANISLRELSKVLTPLSQELPQELNPVIFTAREFQKKISKKDHFLLEIIRSPKLWIIGDAAKFEQMVEGREAKKS